MSEVQTKFASLSRPLFQCDAFKLDCGIYRIKNLKRGTIMCWLVVDLPKAITHQDVNIGLLARLRGKAGQQQATPREHITPFAEFHRNHTREAQRYAA